jgi:transcription initiation factor TFIIIB Brf1 subunit/transcription initiation factor TFIIB
MWKKLQNWWRTARLKVRPLPCPGCRVNDKVRLDNAEKPAQWSCASCGCVWRQERADTHPVAYVWPESNRTAKEAARHTARLRQVEVGRKRFQEIMKKKGTPSK